VIKGQDIAFLVDLIQGDIGDMSHCITEIILDGWGGND